MIWMLVILLLPLFFLLWKPVWFRDIQSLQSEENLRLYRERTAELAASDWADEDKAALQLELDREFLASDSGSDESVRAAGNTSSVRLLVPVLIVAFASTFGLYQLWGASGELRATELLDKGEAVELTRLEREELMTLLGGASQRFPDQLEWGYLNARLLSAAGKYEQAFSVFESILKQMPEEASADRAATLTLMAEAKFFAAGQRADETTYALIQQALDLNPQSRQALGLAGILAFELDKAADALMHWKTLWQSLPAGPESQVLAQGIRRAAERLQSQGESVDLSWLQRAELKVLVELSEEARAQVSEGDSVFVLARAVSGPPMPLAVQRMQVSDLPQVVTLSDAQAMAPGMNLSSFDQVSVVARVSKSGQPLPQSGDWQIVSEPVANNHGAVLKLVISQLVE